MVSIFILNATKLTGLVHSLWLVCNIIVSDISIYVAFLKFYIEIVTVYLIAIFVHMYKMNRVVRKLASCICENKDADQLRGNREADQRLCVRYIDSTIPLHVLSKYEISSL